MGVRRQHVRLLNQTLAVTIGTLGDSDLALTDPTVSRNHAVVEEKADGYLLRDLGSTNGTYLDGVKVRVIPTEPFVAQ